MHGRLKPRKDGKAAGSCHCARQPFSDLAMRFVPNYLLESVSILRELKRGIGLVFGTPLSALATMD